MLLEGTYFACYNFDNISLDGKVKKMAQPITLEIISPSAARARALPGLLGLPSEIKIEVIREIKGWLPHPARPAVVDLASPEGVLAKLNAALEAETAPPVLMVGEPWQMTRKMSARLNQRLVFASLPLQDDSPSRAAALLLEGFNPPEDTPDQALPVLEKPVEETKAEPSPTPTETEPEPEAPLKADPEVEDSVEEMVEKLEMLLGEEDD